MVSIVFSRRRPRFGRESALLAGVCLVVCAHASLLGWSAAQQGPTWDEVGFMPAGIRHWTFREFDLYRVNPPLVRMVATAPAMVAAPVVNWSAYLDSPTSRPEFEIGRQFIRDHGAWAFRLFTLARWACIPFSLLGAWICFRWARELYGGFAGLVALGLWCFSPNILAHGQMITPDVGATALGVAAAYCFWHWLRAPTWSRAFFAGVVLGLAELAKFTLVVFFPLWPALWIVWRLGGMPSRSVGMSGRLHGDASDAMPPLTPGPSPETGEASPHPGPLPKGEATLCPHPDPLPKGEGTDGARHWTREAAQLAVVLLLAVYVINLGYGFEGSLKPLGDYHLNP